MSLMGYFRKEQQASTASVAKERLQILVAHDRARSNAPDYLPQLQRDLMAVIRKYANIVDEDVSVTLESQGTTSVLELNVVLPDR